MIKIYYNNEIPKGYQDTLITNGIRLNDVKFVILQEYNSCFDNYKDIVKLLGNYKIIPTIMDHYICVVLM